MVKYKPMFRIVTFVPPEALFGVVQAVMSVAKLTYGTYENVLWHSSPGIEHFTPMKESHPTAGKKNVHTALPSIRLEFSIANNEAAVRRIIEEGIIPAHPWEEPVIHYYPVTETRAQYNED